MAQRKDARKRAQAKTGRPINGAKLRAAVAWAVDRQMFAHLPLHGNTKWQIVDLILLTVVWVWSNDRTLTGAFVEARQWSLDVLGRVALDSYQGLLKALVRWTASWLPVLWEHLHRLMQEQGRKHWRVGLWLALAVDGSRVSVPRTQANEQAFCAPHVGTGKTTPAPH